VARGGGGGGLTNRAIDGATTIFWNVTLAVAILMVLFYNNPGKGIDLAGKGVAVVATAAGAAFTFLTTTVPAGLKNGSNLAAGSGGSAPAAPPAATAPPRAPAAPRTAPARPAPQPAQRATPAPVR
jgi:hypothetical protein